MAPVQADLSISSVSDAANPLTRAAATAFTTPG